MSGRESIHTGPSTADSPESVATGVFPYRRLWRNTVILTAIVTLAPLLIMTVVNYYQYEKALTAELAHPTSKLLESGQRSLEFFIAERLSALHLVIRSHSKNDLSDQAALETTLRNVSDSFSGFVDLGLIDAQGNQVAYAGPYGLRGRNYKDQGWFHEVALQGEYVSDIFMGFRDVPHFVIAVRRQTDDGSFHVLRATVGAEQLKQYAKSLDLKPTSDSFIINRQGVLQTPSRFHGGFLEPCTLPVPDFLETAQVREHREPDGTRYVLGYAYIARSPFVLMMVRRPEDMLATWLAIRGEFIGFFLTSVVLILVVILWNTTQMVSRLRRSDARRAEFLHNVEYTSKMASIGRLAAGVAHEINNPLAIINEKAGLLTDIVAMSSDFPRREDILKIVKSISASVDRCSTITHRLLGFAKRMDVTLEPIDLADLMAEVLSFLGREASYRNVSVEIHADPGGASIESDRGQLQQVFLNIINNALAAVSDGGSVDIWIEHRKADNVAAVRIQDNGIGISKDNLPKIFEPFFTTKKEYGTGLGLSITYGIVKKLGGDIMVESEVGKGTCFTVILPMKTTKF